MLLRDTAIDAVVAGHTSDVVLNTTAAVAEHHLLLLLKTAIISSGHSCVEHSCSCYWTQLLLSWTQVMLFLDIIAVAGHVCGTQLPLLSSFL